MSYCNYCEGMSDDNVHKVYHDNQYGFPINDDDELFGRLILEINQAGLSWETILKKESGFRKAYDEFSIDKISNYKDKDIQRLLKDSSIIRNKLKVNAAIFNAQKIKILRNDFGSFKGWLDYYHPLNSDEWTKLFKKTFKFVGREIVNEFLMSTGYLLGAHEKSCPIFDKVLKEKPKWSSI